MTAFPAIAAAIGTTSAPIIAAIAVALASALAPVPTLAQSANPAAAPGAANPTSSRPLRIIVTFPPGGSADGVVRLIAPRLSERLGQQVIVDNRPGAGGNIGLDVVAKAEPDGNTIGVGAAGGLAANVSLYAKMPFDPIKDLAPLTLLAHIPFVLVANPAQPAQTISALISQSKAAPAALSVAHGGNGTAMHLSVQLLKQMAGISLTEVPYRGSGPAAIDALGGQVPLAMVDLPASLQHIKAGKLTALAVTGASRIAALPDVPTMSEAGVPGYESTGWFGMVAPAATPPAVLARLDRELQAVLRDEAVRTGARTLGVELSPMTPAEFGRFIAAETTKWRGVITTSGTRLE